MNADAIEISVVIPVFNEEQSLNELYERVTKTLETIGETYEIITVDDGSVDRSLEILRGLRERDKRWRVALLTRNFGQSPAIYAGFSLARGRYVFMIDADLQMFPEDIPTVYEKLKEGYDMVSGWRKDRKDNPFRMIMSRMLNLYTERVTGFPLHDHGCSLKGFQRSTVERMVAFTHRNRYLPLDAAMLGGRVTEVPVRHRERPHGHSKYDIFKLFQTGFNLITMITITPLQFISIAGMLSSMTGAGMGAVVFLLYVINGELSLLPAILAALFFFTGIQLAAMGLMGEYVGRIYIETQCKPLFIIREELE